MRDIRRIGRRVGAIACLASAITLGGCGTVRVSAEDEAFLERLERVGVKPREGGSANPTRLALANAWGPIGLLFGPDIGYFPLGGAANFFLADQLGSDAGQRWLGVVNTATWPVSTLWSVPQVIRDSHAINRSDTVFFYTKTRRGLAALDRLMREAGPDSVIESARGPAPTP